MCGIVAVLRATSNRPVPAAGQLLDHLHRAESALAGAPGASSLEAAAAALEALDRELRGLPGTRALIEDRPLARSLDDRCTALASRVGDIERDLDLQAAAGDGVEATNAALVRLKDAAWAVRNDRLRNARAVAGLAGDALSPDALGAYLSIQIALSAIDRLEVRGRDSAGIHVLVDGHGLDPAARDVASDLRARSHPLFTDGSVRLVEGRLGFVYKAAAEIGELGDNTAQLRATIAADPLLRRALSSPGATATVLGHTRWASVGIISEPNAHPLNSEEADACSRGPYVVAALNGDVDNHLELRASESLEVAPEITTDAKVIPPLVSRRVADGDDVCSAFRTTVARFSGSVAIAASTSAEPDALLLALRGSGQALYVGLAEDAFVVASEPYGLVEETSLYLRMDGEEACGLDGRNGQCVELRQAGAGSVGGIRRFAYDGTELPVSAEDLSRAEITTRDIDRGGSPHFLLKEIGEAPSSIRKTLRGKIVEDRGRPAVRLPAEAAPADLAGRIAAGTITRVIATGQGTAAVAARSVAAAFEDAFALSRLAPSAMTAAELSGFALRDDMNDTLVVAVSQSGTSTDTNRTVDLVRARGAVVVAIVNRRNSDLVDKSDGVLYTSDGRDVEMAVPSTKAFYAQVAAGLLLAWGLADAAGVADRHRAAEVLDALRRLPKAMEEVLSRRAEIAALAQRYAPARRYWAVVGNGPNAIAAAEVRIKVSELCYKSVAFDVTEDKKHIDLSSEPLIILCAAGLEGPTADDVAKEVAIFRAHKAAPIVVASEGEDRFDAALGVIFVPSVHPQLDFVLSAMAGHLFGYEAAVAIDAQARLLREARGVIEESIAESAGSVDLASIGSGLGPLSERYLAELRSGALNGHLEAATAVRLTSLLHYATGTLPLEVYEVEYGKVGSPSALVEDLLDALSDGIDELTRPVDAIKHQAKTVTVGISRSEDDLSKSRLVQEVLRAGATRDRIGYKALRTLAELDPAVDAVTGFSRYVIEGDVAAGTATISRVDAGGVAAGLPTRTDEDPTLKGTKRRAAFEREVTVSRGERDGRTIVIVPEVKDGVVTGITLLHVALPGRLDAPTARKVLTGYRHRYAALVDAVTETEPSFDDGLLGEVDLVSLLVDPVKVLARRWRRVAPR